MQNLEKQLDPWIRSYIVVHYPRQTRYQIDRYLIDAGYDPKSIEAVWEVILPKPPVPNPVWRWRSLLQVSHSPDFYIGAITYLLVGLALIHLNIGENYRVFILTQFLALPLMLLSLFLVIGMNRKFEINEIRASKVKRWSQRVLKLLIVVFLFSAFTSLLDDFKTLDSKVVGNHRYYLASRVAIDYDDVDHFIYIFECDTSGLICQKTEEHGGRISMDNRLEKLQLVVDTTGKVGYEIR